MTIEEDIKKDFFKEKCLKNSLKITPQRTIIYEELVKTKDHPSADVIYKRVRKLLPNISFDTVYRTLESFSEIGVIQQVEGSYDSKRFDSDLETHHHFHCLRCKKIIDFNDPKLDVLTIPEELNKKFKVTNKKVVLEGYCHECLAN